MADMSADNSDCAELPCILVQDQEVEQRIVSDVPADFLRVKPLGNIAVISERGELERPKYSIRYRNYGCNSCDSSGKSLWECKTLRESKVKESKTVGDLMFTGASTSASLTIHEGKGISRPLYGRLQKHKKRRSQFSNQQNKWTLPRRKFPDTMPHIEYRGAPVGHENGNKAAPHVVSRRSSWA